MEPEQRKVGTHGEHILRANLRTEAIELYWDYGLGGYRHPVLKARDVDDYIAALSELRDWLNEQAQNGEGA